MVGTVRTCVRLRSLSGIALSAGIFLGLPPVASVWAASGESARTEPAQSISTPVQVIPDAVSFIDVPAGDTYTQTVRITNVSEGTLQIKEIMASSADFSITGILLPVVVAPGTSENFTVSYRARAEARVEGQIRIVTSSGGGPIVLNVRASTVMGQKELTASEAGIDFDDVAVGNSGKREVSLLNAGNRDLTVSEISVSGVDFSVSGSGGVTLSPGQKFTVNVNFAPRNAGRQAGSLRVRGADGGSLLELPLSGLGAASSQSVVKLNWEANPASTAGYVIYRSADPNGPFTRITTQAVPSAEYVDTGLAAGHTYYYVVTSVGADEMESEYSAPISATVPEA
jgi:Abnormal spindle-like microcephaly-assoc'd, ASPM-SPD-2-Hydin